MWPSTTPLPSQNPDNRRLYTSTTRLSQACVDDPISGQQLSGHCNRDRIVRSCAGTESASESFECPALAFTKETPKAITVSGNVRIPEFSLRRKRHSEACREEIGECGCNDNKKKEEDNVAETRKLK
ncbi:hypothetical protein MRX96_041995 [Rhipicephalus microplus]